MLVTPSGIVIEVRLEQLLKALFPMLVTPSGIVIEVRLVQLLKAFFKIEVVQPNSILYPPPIGPAVFNSVQPLKALFPMLVTPSGIVIEVRLEQLLKA